jgi:hypothetical protein
VKILYIAILAFDHLIWHTLVPFDHFGKTPAHEALDPENGIFRVDQRLVPSYLAHQLHASLGEPNSNGSSQLFSAIVTTTSSLTSTTAT